MPPAIEPPIKKKVIPQWLAGDSRSKIAIDNNKIVTIRTYTSELCIGALCHCHSRPYRL